MREILFKAKRVDNGEWIEGQFVLDAIDTPRIVVKDKLSEGLLFIHVIQDSVCQFTGMKSLSGLKVFENDTVSFMERGIEKYAIVEWNAKSHSFVLGTPSYGKNFTRLSGRGKLLLIGNIHD